MHVRLTRMTVCLSVLLAVLWNTPANAQAPKPRLVVQAEHTQLINSVAFSPDGRTIASASHDQSIKLWDAASGEELRTLAGHTGGVDCVAFSPDGKTLVSGSEDTTIKLWDAATGRELRTLTGHPSAVDCVTFSPDGRTIASGGGDIGNNQILKLWDAATGQELRTLQGETDLGPGLEGLVTSVAFSPDGKTLASGGSHGADGNSVILWNAATGREIRALAPQPDAVSSVAFSPDGRTLASCSADHIPDQSGRYLPGEGPTTLQPTIKLWDATTGQELRTLIGQITTQNAVTVTTGHTQRINSVAFSPDGRTLASGGDDGKIKVWDIATGLPRQTLFEQTDAVHSVAFSPDGKAIASGGGSFSDVSQGGANPAAGDQAVKLWDAATGKPLYALTGQWDKVISVVFSRDGKTLASVSEHNKVGLWDAISGQPRQTIHATDHEDLLAISPDAKTFVGIDTDRTSHAQTLKLWDAVTGRELHPFTGQSGRVWLVCFSPDGRTLASASEDTSYDAENRRTVSVNTIKLWDVVTGQVLRTLAGDGSTIGTIAFSPDGKTLACGGGRRLTGPVINLWDVATGQILHTFSVFGENPGQQSGFGAQPIRGVTSVALSPDGRILAGACMDIENSGTIGERQKYSIILWNAATGQELHTLSGHTQFINCVAFSPDGGTLASGSSDKTVKLWDAASGEELRTLAGHTGGVDCVAFSPDGKTLASGSADKTVRLWDIAGGQEVGSLYAVGDTGWAVVTPDGRFDTGNLDDIQGIHWVLPDQPFTPVPVEAFFAQYYTPGLLAHLLRRDPLPPLPDISTINHVQPTVAIDAVVPHSGGDPALVDVTVSYTGQQADATQPDGTKKTDTSGVYDLRLFRNGQLVAALPEGATSGVAPTDLSGGTAGKAFTHTFTVRLVRDGAKTVPFTAYAFNSDKVKSLTSSRDYTPTSPLPTVQGRAWVLAFGADAYDDPHLLPDLRFAAADAGAYGTGLVPRLEKTGRYAKVTFVPLISGTGPANPDELPAIKAALRATLDALAGKTPDSQDVPFTALLQKLGVTKAAPEDLLLLAFSCHGDADPQTGEYYLFPAHLGPDLSRWPDPALAGRGLSSAELTAWMQGVDAGEMAMVIDSCHSAAAAGPAFKPGPMDSPGLGQLAYYKRMRILSASAADAAAKEYADLGHGLLTAALVGDGLVNGQAKPAAGQDALTVGPWLTFAEADVPRLDARENGPAAPVRPGKKGTALDNPPVSSDAGLQRPSLFDFHRVGVPDAVVAAGP